jgi:drug/metabolite transporter (DMT)-like permease
MNSVSFARLLTVLAAVLFSTGGAGIKIEAFSGLQVSALRSGLAALVLLLVAKGRLVWAPQVTGAGVVYAATLTLFVLATKLTTAANAIFLQATAPIYLLVLGPFVLGEPIRRRDVVSLVLVAAGVLFCFIGQPPATLTAPDPARGNLLGLACSVTWALTLASLRYVERDAGRTGLGLTAMIVGNVLASMVALPFAWPYPDASLSDWATVVYLGVAQIGLAYAFLTSAIRHLPALEVSLLLLIEPVLNPAWTWLLRGEDPGAWTIAGGAIIVSVMAARSVYEAKWGSPQP